MKYLLSTILLSCSFYFAGAQDGRLRIVMIGAHPDDCDIKSGGTAALFAEMGHQVKFISVTNGDAGHMEQGGGALAKRRRAEATEAAKRLGITYEVMDNHDGELMPTLDIRLDLIRKIRAWNADVVISHRPVDYHPDHRYTGILVQDAAFMVMVPNIAADMPPLKKNPVFLYFQDHFTKPSRFQPDVCVDITQVMDKKMEALDAHESQFYEWLPWIMGYKGTIPAGKQERKDWIRNSRWPSMDTAVRAGLEKWYGPQQAKAARYAEAFELCEYGSRPTEKEIRQLFPMLGGQ
ncbi:PIG-L deacetylase family protein [Chitinophaga japonensis]|uniref:LmbE family N-acetylglucosaminyl deacetylase n=1 Tax=Chitinophaga japonensis TaxID=104662 RepID=A0A562SS23_CHIJA|nr:PIG-L deacetylase family protein [Chitinophaga japonensis]TWI84059.1 LmbE family N-acetylglucosaminyl deacetylase [Chitinophaga japonensis]